LSFLTIPTDALHKFQAIAGTVLILAVFTLAIQDITQQGNELAEIARQVTEMESETQRIREALTDTSKRQIENMQTLDAIREAATTLKCPSAKCDKIKDNIDHFTDVAKQLRTARNTLDEDLTKLQIATACVGGNIAATKQHQKTNLFRLIFGILVLIIGFIYARKGFLKWAQKENPTR